MPKKKEAGPEHGDEFPGREVHATTLQAETRGGGAWTSTLHLERGSDRPSGYVGEQDQLETVPR